MRLEREAMRRRADGGCGHLGGRIQPIGQVAVGGDGAQQGIMYIIGIEDRDLRRAGLAHPFA